ncbi:MAG: YicC/YloC family endoribonuclease [Pseudomonadota bacterium]
MTGFARVDGEAAGAAWTWEIKSVNARGLEPRFRLPPGYDGLEHALRRDLGARLARGALSIHLSLNRGQGAFRLAVNEDALAAAAAAAEAVASKTGGSVSADAIFAARGVLESVEGEPTAEERAALDAALRKTFAAALDALVAARRDEGAAVARVLLDRLAALRALLDAARADAASTPEAIRTRLDAQLGELLSGVGAEISDDRLAQEAAALAVKADVREELDRLGAHIDAVGALLAAGGPTGRKIDFLTQELGREANTLCAKAATLSLKRIGLDMKAVVDQIREQIQNVE